MSQQHEERRRFTDDLTRELEDERTRILRDHPQISQTDHTQLYIVGAITLCLCVAACAVVLSILRPGDTSTMTTILTVLVPVILAIIAKIQGHTHRATNGRLTRLLEVERALARIQGRRDPRTPRPGQQPTDQG